MSIEPLCAMHHGGITAPLNKGRRGSATEAEHLQQGSSAAHPLIQTEGVSGLSLHGCPCAYALKNQYIDTQDSTAIPSAILLWKGLLLSHLNIAQAGLLPIHQCAVITRAQIPREPSWNICVYCQ